MAVMDYITPGITKIDFEDSFFVTTEIDRDISKDVEEYIESRGGIIKGSVTRSTNYLIYGDGEEETTKYNKALELIRGKGQEIAVLPLSLFYTAIRGEGIIEFGSYPFEKDGTRRPIQWNILKRNGNKALLFSAYGLVAKLYHERYEDVTWETCSLRKWLNEDFYRTAFTDDEKNRILPTRVKNEDNPWCNTPGGNDTEDRVFLLSTSEAWKYLPAHLNRVLAPTPYAKESGVLARGYYDSCSWWLRSPGSNSNNAADVSFDDVINDFGDNVNRGNCAVCPALWINLDSEI